MKKIMGVSAIILMLLFCLGTAIADEGKIEQLIKNYETACNERDIALLRTTYHKVYLQVSADLRNKLYWSSSEGDIVFKETEKFFRILKSHKVANIQITVQQSIAYVHCDEFQTFTNGKKSKSKTLITCVKDKGRWYIAMQSSQEVE